MDRRGDFDGGRRRGWLRPPLIRRKSVGNLKDFNSMEEIPIKAFKTKN